MQDRHLLKRMRTGEVDALRQIFEKYRDDLFTVAVSLSQDNHVSEDCLQDVFVRLAENSDSFNVRRNLKSYLISCVANRARDYMRRKTAQPDYPLEQLRCPALSTDPTDEIISSEAVAQVLKALAELPYEQREAFVLHVQGELKFREIAKLQNVSIKTAQSRYRYAIEKLREILKKGERL